MDAIENLWAELEEYLMQWPGEQFKLQMDTLTDMLYNVDKMNYPIIQRDDGTWTTNISKKACRKHFVDKVNAFYIEKGMHQYKMKY
jgi:hypothetical protein